MIKKFIQSEAFIGVLLLLAVIFACLFVNSSFSQYYYNLFNFNLPLNLSFVGIYKEMNIQALG